MSQEVLYHEHKTTLSVGVSLKCMWGLQPKLIHSTYCQIIRGRSHSNFIWSFPWFQSNLYLCPRLPHDAWIKTIKFHSFSKRKAFMSPTKLHHVNHESLGKKNHQNWWQFLFLVAHLADSGHFNRSYSYSYIWNPGLLLLISGKESAKPGIDILFHNFSKIKSWRKVP